MMKEQYSETTAYHYAAYRPPLHQLILSKALSDADHYKNGLDVGCGTGYSSVALGSYCQHVYGVDPSRSMLEKATPHEKITYMEGAGENIPVEDQSVDIVTLAGVLSYTKSDRLVAELKRVCKPNAILIPYDFAVLLDDLSQQFGIPVQRDMSDYDHSLNFSGISDFQELIVDVQEVSLGVSATALAHILLSDSHRYDAFSKKYQISNPFQLLVNDLSKAQHSLKANIFFSKYQIR